MPHKPVRDNSPSKAELRAKMKRVDAALAKVFGSPTWQTEDPLDSLIATILSQNTNDKNSGAAYDAMRRAFPTWRDVMEAKPSALERALQPGGLAKTKAARIQCLLRALERRGGLDLEFLRPLSDARAEEALLAFDGVGYKTARCVLMFALGRDVFPVDTHIERILKRLEIVPEGFNADACHRFVADLVPKGRALPLHLNLIHHGRAVCHARHPECGVCVLRRSCRYREGLSTATV